MTNILVIAFIYLLNVYFFAKTCFDIQKEKGYFDPKHAVAGYVLHTLLTIILVLLWLSWI